MACEFESHQSSSRSRALPTASIHWGMKMGIFDKFIEIEEPADINVFGEKEILAKRLAIAVEALSEIAGSQRNSLVWVSNRAYEALARIEEMK